MHGTHRGKKKKTYEKNDQALNSFIEARENSWKLQCMYKRYSVQQPKIPSGVTQGALLA